jgi:hypothetical protein
VSGLRLGEIFQTKSRFAAELWKSATANEVLRLRAPISGTAVRWGILFCLDDDARSDAVAAADCISESSEL